MSRLKDAFFDQINEAQNDDYGQFEAYTKANPNGSESKSLEETLGFAKDYMKSDKFAQEWDKWCQTGDF